MSEYRPTYHECLGRAMRDARAEAEVTLGDVSRALGERTSTVSGWERGRITNMTDLQLRAYASLLGMETSRPIRARATKLFGAGTCYDCGRRYGDEYGFPDLHLEDHVWNLISPTGDDGGLLCPSCICKRLHAAGFGGVKQALGVFMSGPIISVREHDMERAKLRSLTDRELLERMRAASAYDAAILSDVLRERHVTAR